MKNLVILISGRGSNMQAIVDAASTERWPARVAAVISNRADAEGLAWAKSRGIATRVIDHCAYASREGFDAALISAIDVHMPHVVALAGFMRVLTPGFVSHYEGRLVNVHPSLLPAFPGINTHRAALQRGVKVHGCTVHFVTEKLDHGPIIAQAAVPVLPGDDEKTLAARVLLQEHHVYPRAVRWLVEGRLVLTGNVVCVNDQGHDDVLQSQLMAG